MHERFQHLDDLLYQLLLREEWSSELVAIGRLETLLVIFSCQFVVLLDFEPDYAVDKFRIGFINQNFKDRLAVKGAFVHLHFIKLKVV